MLIAPARFEIRDNDDYFQTLRIEITKELNNRNIEVLNLVSRFQAFKFVETHFKHDGHWSPKGHKIAAQTVVGWLKTKSLKR